MVCGTPTRATSTTPTVGARAVRRVARWSSSATGTSSATYRLTDDGRCQRVRRADLRTLRRATRHVGCASRARAPGDVHGRTVAVSATRVRTPAVAGTFYPADPDELARQVDALLDAAPVTSAPTPKAFILPHAGYVYSGPIAATGYAMLRNRQRARHDGSCCSAPRIACRFAGWLRRPRDCWRTPLGDVPIDAERARRGVRAPGCRRSTTLRMRPSTASRFTCRSSNACWATASRSCRSSSAEPNPRSSAAVLDLLWGGRETVIVVSSDLSHYLDSRHGDGARHTHCVADPELWWCGDRHRRRMRRGTHPRAARRRWAPWPHPAPPRPPQLRRHGGAA